MGRICSDPSRQRKNMAVRKQCKSKGCKSTPRCDHSWWFDVMHDGKRHRMPADEFVLPRLEEEGKKPTPITSKRELEMVWEPRFRAEIVAGRDLKLPPEKHQAERLSTVAEL